MPIDVAIGIDLGTTFSCVGVFQNGKVEIIANDQGHRTTPSYVLFNKQERLIGEAAFIQVTRNQMNRVFDAKRLIGRKLSDECVQKDMKHWPFNVINSGGNPKIRIDFMGETKDFHPEEISSMVLVKMKETAESYLGKKVENAVITVPAYFNDSQRQATKDAGIIAGLNVMKVINEPTAAAIAYGYDKSLDVNVLIYDFGGGTFDVSVLHIKNKQIVVKSTGGDTHLGGEDINNILVDHFVEEIKRRHKKDIKDNKRSIGILRREIERAKKALSHSPVASIEIDCLIDDISFDSSITRAKFNDLCNGLFQSTINHLEKALIDAKMEKKDISEVILVGGSSRIPKVQELVQQFFDGKELNKSINLDEAVAYGAAIQAAVLSGDESEILKGLTISYVTPLSLGIDGRNGLVDVLIPRNSQIPISVVSTRTTVYDNQKEIRFKVCEGERPIEQDNNILGQLTLTGLPPLPKREAKFDLTYSIDVNGILSVTVVDKSIGTVNNIRVNNEKGRLSASQIKKMIEDGVKYKNQDLEERERATSLIKLDDYCYDTKKKMMIPENEEKVPFVYRKLVIDACDEVSNWIDQNKTAEKRVIEKKETDLKIICQPTLRLFS